MKALRVSAVIVGVTMHLLPLGMTAQAALDVGVEEPIEVMQSLAAAGDPTAQYNLGFSYQIGRGNLGRNMDRALEWYRKSATAGFLQAQLKLGELLINGTEVPKDEKEAVRWIYAAAQAGSYDAQKWMIKIYATGRGVGKSPTMALMWDVLARRTLELRTGLPAGLPPEPGALRADGAVEMAGKDGTKEWLHADGMRETLNAGGVRCYEHKEWDERKITTVQANGEWETLYKNGMTEQMNVQGRRTVRHPNGRLVITEPDGSRTEEGDGTMRGGFKVRIRDSYDSEGKRISRKIFDGDVTIEERPDGSRLVETKVQEIKGAALILTEEVGADGKQGNGRLRRAEDGAGPKEGEVWTIRRTLKQSDRSSVEVLEKYCLPTKRFPPQLAGFAYKTELLLGAGVDRQNRTESIKVLCHEVTHALISRYYPGRKPPLWLNEGLAEYIALRTMRSKGGLTKIEDSRGNSISLAGTPDRIIGVESVFTRERYGEATTPDRMAAFYANSQKCVQTLFEKLPVDGFPKFFNALVAGNCPDAAFNAAYGKQCASASAFQSLVNAN